MLNITPKVAILYQAQQPPAINGIIKPMKPGGYSDSGADIAYSLKQKGINIITPKANPDISTDLDWVFPDTTVGIKQAIKAGATHLWLNTVLYKGHPIEAFTDVWLVGQQPANVDLHDDKWYTNSLLREQGMPIPKAELITSAIFENQQPGIDPPLVAKPIRGRGSEGVTLINTPQEYKTILQAMFNSDRYGTAVYIEEYLSGQEVTVTVMPAGAYEVNGNTFIKQAPWCLPAVKRFNHQNGVAPYNGTVAIIHNSEVLSNAEESTEAIQQIYHYCAQAAALVGLKAPIRIDCRANNESQYFLFDLNMKPNMTGAARPHRHDQDSLTALAARKFGWGFDEFITNILAQAWKI